MTVRFSCRCPNTDYLGFEASPEAIVAAAKKAEELGLRRDLRQRPHHRRQRSRARRRGRIATTRSSRSPTWARRRAASGIGVSVLIVPYRNPIATAKALATIDRMSGGRLIAGVGVGWNEGEYRRARRAVRRPRRADQRVSARVAGLLGAGQGVVRRQVRAVLRDVRQPQAAAAAAPAVLERRRQRRGDAPRGPVLGRMAADPAAGSPIWSSGWAR